MEEHDNETRELEQTMERALAVAIAHGSSIVESWAKLAAKQRNRTARGADTDELAASGKASEDLGRTASKVQQRARHDLAKGRADAEFWRTASPDELVARFQAEAAEKDPLRDAGSDARLDPRRLGDRAYDRQWAQSTKGIAVVGVLDLAHRYADEAAVAANVRDNLREQIRDLGLDPDELMRMDPAEAGRRYEESLGTSLQVPDTPFSLGPNSTAAPTMTLDGSDSVDRDGAQVAALLSQAQAADQRAAEATHNAEIATERAETPARSESAPDRGDPLDIPPPLWGLRPESMSRAERVGTASATAPGRAAATAARDHPTNPRAAVAAPPRSQARAKTGGGKSADRQRGRGM